MSRITGSSALVLALSLAAGSAMAADMPLKARPAPPAPVSWWEIAYGGAVMSDYNFRGISQSDRNFSGTFYAEGRYNIVPDRFQVYGGIQAWNTKLPTTPTGEFDLYGGIRPTFGPVAFDFGYIYYWYPRETQLFFTPGFGAVSPTNFGFGQFTVRDTDFWEVYGKVTWTVNPTLALGAYVYYSPDWLRTGARATYAGATAKVTLPSTWFPSDWGGSVSGEFAHYWIGTFTAFGAPFDLPDYNYGNIGVSFTYKAMTADIRYHATDLNQTQCFLLTGDTSGVTTARSRWCGNTVIGKLSFDTTMK